LFIQPWLFISLASIIVIALCRRNFASAALRALEP